jgi:hypothetical protein
MTGVDDEQQMIRGAQGDLSSSRLGLRSDPMIKVTRRHVLQVWQNRVKTLSVLAVGISFSSERQMPRVIAEKRKVKEAT